MSPGSTPCAETNPSMYIIYIDLCHITHEVRRGEATGEHVAHLLVLAETRVIDTSSSLAQTEATHTRASDSDRTSYTHVSAEDFTPHAVCPERACQQRPPSLIGFDEEPSHKQRDTPSLIRFDSSP